VQTVAPGGGLPAEASARDVVIDLYCYRKYGHNEGDEPRFTQPLMYAKIDQKRTVREVFIDRLVETARSRSSRRRRSRDRAAVSTSTACSTSRRRAAFDLVPNGDAAASGRSTSAVATRTCRKRQHGRARARSSRRCIDKITTVPEGFTPHPRVQRFVLDKQRETLTKNEPRSTGAPRRISRSRRSSSKARAAVSPARTCVAARSAIVTPSSSTRSHGHGYTAASRA
jgi:2-oxoglutarate dehydrogenase E1 component